MHHPNSPKYIPHGPCPMLAWFHPFHFFECSNEKASHKEIHVWVYRKLTYDVIMNIREYLCLSLYTYIFGFLLRSQFSNVTEKLRHFHFTVTILFKNQSLSDSMKSPSIGILL